MKKFVFMLFFAGLFISLNGARFTIGRDAAILEQRDRELRLIREQMELQRRQLETQYNNRPISDAPAISPNFQEVIGYTVVNVDTIMQCALKEYNQDQYILMKLSNGRVYKAKYAPVPNIVFGQTQVVVFQNNNSQIKLLVNGMFLQVSK